MKKTIVSLQKILLNRKTEMITTASLAKRFGAFAAGLIVLQPSYKLVIKDKFSIIVAIWKANVSRDDSPLLEVLFLVQRINNTRNVSFLNR